MFTLTSVIRIVFNYQLIPNFSVFINILFHPSTWLEIYIIGWIIRCQKSLIAFSYNTCVQRDAGRSKGWTKHVTIPINHKAIIQAKEKNFVRKSNK